MLIKNLRLDRRRVLRGTLAGGAVTVALPFLDLFLNDSGNALANDKPLPVRFGTWFWGLGMNKNIFIPKKVGADFDLPEEIAALKNVKQHINLFTNFRVPLDGKPNLCHFSGWVGTRLGSAPAGRGDLPTESFDVSIADLIGNTTRFRMLNAAATGVPQDSYSLRNGDAVNPPEISAIEMYRKIFGPDFQDPNSPTFTPNPKIMMRKSVVSAVMDQKSELERSLGAADKARMDQYFTSLRELEGRLERQLEKPPAAPNCVIPTKAPPEIEKGVDADLIQARHNAMTDLMVMALSCNQTNVFNMLYSNSGSHVTKKGFEKTHHILTHEEPIDEKLGYQPTTTWFVRRAMGCWAYFVEAMAKTPEGDGCLLDRSLVFAHSDGDFAKVHSIEGVPMFTAGKANGRIKTGMHIDGNGETSSRVSYTMQRIMGLPIAAWGSQSMRTSREIGEILV